MMKKRFGLILTLVMLGSVISPMTIVEAETTVTTDDSIWSLVEPGETVVVENGEVYFVGPVKTMEDTNPKDVTKIDNTQTNEDTNEVPVDDEELEEVDILYEELPSIVQKQVDKQKNNYPKLQVGVGIYSLDGDLGYEYNADQLIAGGCTIKAPYAMFVLKECERLGIDIYTETIEHTKYNTHGGSGTIQYSKYGTKYTIYELLDKLLGISDNAAYYMLQSKFPLKDYQDFIIPLGGQKLEKGQGYGYASVSQRKNEWLEIYNYISSDSKYSNVLAELMTGTKYCYIVSYTKDDNKFIHKSGWSYGSYSCACDCAIINDNYLVIIMTSIPNSEESVTVPVKSIGYTIIDEYAKSLGGKIF